VSTPYDPNDPSRKPDDERDFDDPDLREEKPKPGGDDGNGKDNQTAICPSNFPSCVDGCHRPTERACPEPDRPK
jgi:hypothetical protein